MISECGTLTSRRSHQRAKARTTDLHTNAVEWNAMNEKSSLGRVRVRVVEFFKEEFQ